MRDPQDGYTAIPAEALDELAVDDARFAGENQEVKSLPGVEAFRDLDF